MKKTFLAIAVAVIFPVVCYLIVKKYSKNAVVMPKHYFYDSVITKEEKGKVFLDTVWHKVKPVPLYNQFGELVTLNDSGWNGKIIIADFFFTSCPTICPRLTKSMKKIQDAFVKNDTIVRFVSFTVDPLRDTVEKMKAFGDKYNINHDTWWLLTGEKEKIYDLALHEFKANIAQEEGVDSNFIHTDKFFLLDRNRVVRGFYSGLDSIQTELLIRDVVTLMMERDKKKKRNLFRK